MSNALRNIPAGNFNPPPGIVRATVDGQSGLLPSPNTPGDSLVTDLFIEGTIPTKTDDVHNYIEICADSGLLATKYCPNRVMTPMVKLPYDVSDAVEDQKARVPTEYCTMHGPDQGPSPLVNCGLMVRITRINLIMIMMRIRRNRRATIVSFPDPTGKGKHLLAVGLPYWGSHTVFFIKAHSNYIFVNNNNAYQKNKSGGVEFVSTRLV
ncbi:MAG: hypothetical protein RQM92_03215 [Candidatus Syntrophopropionicum ammoniitolerans]